MWGTRGVEETASFPRLEGTFPKCLRVGAPNGLVIPEDQPQVKKDS